MSKKQKRMLAVCVSLVFVLGSAVQGFCQPRVPGNVPMTARSMGPVPRATNFITPVNPTGKSVELRNSTMNTGTQPGLVFPKVSPDGTKVTLAGFDKMREIASQRGIKWHVHRGHPGFHWDSVEQMYVRDSAGSTHSRLLRHTTTADTSASSGHHRKGLSIPGLTDNPANRMGAKAHKEPHSAQKSGANRHAKHSGESVKTQNDTSASSGHHHKGFSIPGLTDNPDKRMDKNLPKPRPAKSNSGEGPHIQGQVDWGDVGKTVVKGIITLGGLVSTIASWF